MFMNIVDHKNGARKLPGAVREYMWHRFNLVPLYLDTLRCFEYDGIVNGKEVKRIRIFSPKQAKEKFLSIKDRVDLDTHTEMLLFEGYIDSNGSVYVADRRAPVHLFEKHKVSGGPGAGGHTNILQPTG
jgi:hypothetical protein